MQLEHVLARITLRRRKQQRETLVDALAVLVDDGSARRTSRSKRRARTKDARADVARERPAYPPGLGDTTTRRSGSTPLDSVET